MLEANLSTVAERMMKYSIHDRAILVDGQPVARIEVLPGELNEARVEDLMSAANRGAGPQRDGATAPPKPPRTGLLSISAPTAAMTSRRRR